ncbi:hypothetical protein ACFQ60_00635 [Streptomyces zhihengii]
MNGSTGDDADGEGVLVGWQPDGLLRGSRDLEAEAHLVSEGLEGLHRAFGIALTVVLGVASRGRLRVTRCGAGSSRSSAAGGSEGADEEEGGGDAGAGGPEAVGAGDGDPLVQDGWQGVDEDEPGAGAGGEQ